MKILILITLMYLIGCSSSNEEHQKKMDSYRKFDIPLEWKIEKKMENYIIVIDTDNNKWLFKDNLVSHGYHVVTFSKIGDIK